MESFQCMDKFQSCLEQFQSNIMLAMYIISVLYIVCFYIVTRHLYTPNVCFSCKRDHDKKVEVSRGWFLILIIFLIIPVFNMILVTASMVYFIYVLPVGGIYYENKETDKPLWLTSSLIKIVNWLKKPI